MAWDQRHTHIHARRLRARRARGRQQYKWIGEAPQRNGWANNQKYKNKRQHAANRMFFGNETKRWKHASKESYRGIAELTRYARRYDIPITICICRYCAFSWPANCIRHGHHHHARTHGVRCEKRNKKDCKLWRLKWAGERSWINTDERGTEEKRLRGRPNERKEQKGGKSAQTLDNYAKEELTQQMAIFLRYARARNRSVSDPC